MIKFKQRSDKAQEIRLDFLPEDMSTPDLERRMRWKGWFCLGYHYVLHENGTIDEGIPLDQYPDPSLPGWIDSLYIAVMCKQLNDAQKLSLSKLKKKLNIPIHGE